MNILSILKGIENLATELLLWIVYIPKTLFKVIKDPFWVRKYVNAELEKDHKFQEYMSPIMLYLATSVILYVLHDMIGSTGKDDSMGKLQGFGLLFLALPLMVALIIEWFRKAPFSRALILRSLYIQCYFLSPLMLAIFAFLLSDSSSYFLEKGSDFNFSSIGWEDIPFPLLLLTIIWFVIIEVKFIANDLKMNRFKSFGILLACVALLYFGFLGFIILTDKTVDNGKDWESESVEFTIKEDGKHYIVVRDKNFNRFDYKLSLIETKNRRRWDSIDKSNRQEYDFIGERLIMDALNYKDKMDSLDYLIWKIENQKETAVVDSLRYWALLNSYYSNNYDLIEVSTYLKDSLNIAVKGDFEEDEFDLEIGQYIVGRASISDFIYFEAKKGQKLRIMVNPMSYDDHISAHRKPDESKQGSDLALMARHNESLNSPLPFGTKWISAVRILYVLMFSYAVFFGYRAFFIYRKRKKQSAREAAREQQENQQKA